MSVGGRHARSVLLGCPFDSVQSPSEPCDLPRTPATPRSLLLPSTRTGVHPGLAEASKQKSLSEKWLALGRLGARRASSVSASPRDSFRRLWPPRGQQVARLRRPSSLPPQWLSVPVRNSETCRALQMVHLERARTCARRRRRGPGSGPAAGLLCAPRCPAWPGPALPAAGQPPTRLPTPQTGFSSDTRGTGSDRSAHCVWGHCLAHSRCSGSAGLSPRRWLLMGW